MSDILLAYHWPGNVRELENCIERAILLAPGETIEPVHLPPSLPLRVKGLERKEHGRLNAVVEAQERELITNALRETGEPDPGGEAPRDDEADHPVPDPEDGD